MTPLLTALACPRLTTWHWFAVDWKYAAWQRQLYFDILNHHAAAPHQFRPLPYGFVRALELFTGDWWFACLTYRCFFTYWFAWTWYRFARLFLAPAAGGFARPVLPLPVLYPLSIAYYLWPVD